MDNFQQPQQGNPGYGGFNPQHNQQVAPVISVKEWMLQMLIMIIPFVNIIMMFVWAFGEGNPTKQNYYKASLLWAAIGIAITIVIYILIIVVFAGAFASSYQS